MIEITVTKFHYLTSANRQHLQLMTTYNNPHSQAHLLADTLTIPLMYNLGLWNNFLKKKKRPEKFKGYYKSWSYRNQKGVNNFSQA